jgi:hypothetical protein
VSLNKILDKLLKYEWVFDWIIYYVIPLIVYVSFGFNFGIIYLLCFILFALIRIGNNLIRCANMKYDQSIMNEMLYFSKKIDNDGR